jgi:hypothetical protein
LRAQIIDSNKINETIALLKNIFQKIKGKVAALKNIYQSDDGDDLIVDFVNALEGDGN